MIFCPSLSIDRRSRPCSRSGSCRRRITRRGLRAANPCLAHRARIPALMTIARLLDGRKLAASMQKEIRQSVEAMQARGLRRPGLAAVLVGRDAASEIYVRNKRKACAEAGLSF